MGDTGVGMWFIVNTFRVLTHVKPHMQDGLYSYARSGFGDFVGFLVAYGYWLCNCFSLVAYGVLIMSTLDIFMPGTFTNGNNVAADNRLVADSDAHARRGIARHQNGCTDQCRRHRVQDHPGHRVRGGPSPPYSKPAYSCVGSGGWGPKARRSGSTCTVSVHR